MAQFISYFLYGMGVVTFIMGVRTFFERKTVVGIGGTFSQLCFSSSIWSFGFSMVFVQTNPELAYQWRCLGMVGTFAYLIFGMRLIIRWGDFHGFVSKVAANFSYLAIFLYPFLLQRKNVEFKMTRIGMSYTFRPGIWNNLYNAYCIILAAFLVAFTAYIWKNGKKRRDRILGRRLVIVEAVLIIGMVMDTVLPMFGIEAFPGSTISQGFGVYAMFVVYTLYKKNLVNVENMTQFIYYSVETPVLVYDDKKQLKIANQSAKEFLELSETKKEVSPAELFVLENDIFENEEKKVRIDTKCRVNEAACRLGVNRIEDEYQDVIGYIVMIEDFTDIVEAKLRADDANRAKSVFLTNMSHEIRTPLNAILGMDELILRENPSEKITEYADSIKRAGNTLLGIISDILDLSKIESKKLSLTEDRYHTAQMLKDVIHILLYKMEEKGLEFKLELQEDVPEILYGDELRVKQIITNILNNAVKYTEKGSITLSVRWEQDIEDKIWLEFLVKDTGTGIREEDMGRLFASFERLDEERNKSIEGTGLGLSITKELTELMGGELWVESTYGEGTLFGIRIRQRIISSMPMGSLVQENIRSKKIKNTRFVAPDARVLIVDDTLVNLRIIRELLKRTEIKTDLAANGMDALDMVKKKDYNMIFIDHLMPEMNGIEVMKNMKESAKEQNRGVPMIALTANAVDGSREFYIEQGFTDYLAKPVDSSKLENMIRKYLPQELVRQIEE